MYPQTHRSAVITHSITAPEVIPVITHSIPAPEVIPVITHSITAPEVIPEVIPVITHSIPRGNPCDHSFHPPSPEVIPEFEERKHTCVAVVV